MTDLPLFRLSPLIALLLLSLVGTAAHSEVQPYTVPGPGDDLVGVNRTVHTVASDTLVDIAARYQLGLNLLRSANPQVDPWLPGEGTPLVLPLLTILPDTAREGIVVNVAEMRLYHYRPAPPTGQPSVTVYAISVGRGEWLTPISNTRVVSRIKDPIWYPPDSIRAEHAARGEVLPVKVPPGPDNPLGEYLLILDLPGYFIHGTNRTFGIGMQSTHGCIRMYPNNIEQLVEAAPNGTPVTIINQPFKVGWREGGLYLEVHQPLEQNGIQAVLDSTEVNYAVVAATRRAQDTAIDWARVDQVIAQASGLPERIGERLPDSPQSAGQDPSTDQQRSGDRKPLQGVEEAVEEQASTRANALPRS